MLSGTANTNEIANLLRALATLIWPVVALTFVVLFRTQIAGLFRRLTKAKILGQEAEFDRDLVELKERATRAEEETPLPQQEAEPHHEASQDKEVAELLHEAATSPKVALMALSADLERRVRQVSATTGWARDARTPRSMLAGIPGIPDSLRDAIEEFWRIRNRIVHGMSASNDDALRALDSGLAIMRALERVPIEKHYVDDPNVPVFADPDCRVRRDDVHGLRLRTVSPDDEQEGFAVHPTTKTDYVKGKQVAWEWSQPAWGRTWYVNPDTDAVEEAWTEAMQFVGRHLDDV